MTSADSAPRRVAIVGCGLIGHKRAEVLGPGELVGCYDLRLEAAEALASVHGGRAFASLGALLDEGPDIVIVATVHASIAELAADAIAAGANVLVEKPAGIGTKEIEHLAAAAEDAGRRVKVGFNHRFHPGIARAVAEAKSGAYGDLLWMRARYGHGGRLGYEQEWRANPTLSGGGEIVDQGMHLIDLANWLFGALPVHSSLLRTQYWDAPVDDSAVVLLGEPGGAGSRSPFALLSVSWTEWKNTFSLEIACRTAKLTVDGLGRSYGPEVLRIYRMRPELGPPDLEEVRYEDVDTSWMREWSHFLVCLESGEPFLGDLTSAHYAWSVIEEAQRP